MALFQDTITLGVSAELTNFEKQILQATARAQKNLKPLELKFANNLSQPLGKITGDISQFNKSVDAAAARVLAFSSTVGIVNGVVNSFKALVKETIEVEKALTDINVVLQTNTKQLAAFQNSLFDIARNTGQSFKAVAEAATELSRQGLGIEKTLKATNAALLLSRLSGLDAAESVKTLTAAMNGFNKEALDYEGIVNRLVNVDSNFAVGTKDLAEAITRVGSTASDANVSFNELLATVTAVQQTTSRGGAVIGNALKTIFTRVGREDTVQQLKELGVAIDQSQTGIEKLRAIAAAVKEVDQGTANTIKELAGGVFQINVVSAALGDLNKQYSIYANALEAANTTTAAAVIRNNALNQSLDALVKTAGTNIDQLQEKIGKLSLGNSLKGLFANFNDFTKFLIDTIDGDTVGATVGQAIVKGVGNFITGPAAVLAIGTFLRLVSKVGSDAFQAFKQFSGISNEARKIAAIQEAYSKTLDRNVGLYQAQLAATNNVELVQRRILADLEAELALRAAINKTVLSSNSVLLKGAASKYDFRSGNLTPRGAEGILPALTAESRDISRGVGGAHASAKTVFIPRFNFGDRTGPVVVNTSEKIVENWMGGKGSAVLNQDMIDALGGENKLSAYGKVKNVAEGYTPSFASFDVAGGKVNLKKRGGDVVLDEILAGFDQQGNRLQGTGIVRKAFDLAVDYGKSIGANGLVVDILNSKVAESLNRNSRFSAFGPFSRGKYRLPIAALSSGLIPNLAAFDSFFDGKATQLGDGAFGTVYDNPKFNGRYKKRGKAPLVFKQFDGSGADIYREDGGGNPAAIEQEYAISKYAEQLGLPVAKVYGSLSNAKKRNGIFKEKIEGFLGGDLKFIDAKLSTQVRQTLKSQYENAGIHPQDLHGANFMVRGKLEDIQNAYVTGGIDAARELALKRSAVVDPGLFFPVSETAKAGYNSVRTSSRATGYIPLDKAIGRETSALVNLGYSPNFAANSVRVGASSRLQGPANPLGLGVYNTAQGQTSLTRAFADHGGQNLKTVGLAGGHIPSLAAPQVGFNVGDLKSAGNRNVSKTLTGEINILLDQILNATTTKLRQDVAQELSTLVGKSKLAPKSLDAITKQFNTAEQYSRKVTNSQIISNKNLRTSGGKFAGQDTVDQLNVQLKTLATTNSPLEAAEAKKELDKLSKSLNAASAKLISNHVKAVEKFSATDRSNTSQLRADIFDEAQKKIANRGFFSLSSAKGIASREQGFGQLPKAEQDALIKSLSADAKANRRATFEKASLGLSFAGSIASPFIDQGAEALRTKGNNTGAGALSTVGGAVTGASLGVVFGPLGAAAGAAVGGLVSLGKAIDGSDTKAKQLTESFDKLTSGIAETQNGFSSFIQTQQKLTGLIEDGAKTSEINRVREELRNVFATITDPQARQAIIASAGDIEKLNESLAKLQTDSLAKVRREGAVTLAAQTKSENTNFFGGRSNSVFNTKAIEGIGTSIVAGASPKELDSLSAALKGLDGSLSEAEFVQALKSVNFGLNQAESLFRDLETPLNRLQVINKVKENIDIAKQLDATSDAATRYKKSIVDLNKTLSTLVDFAATAGRGQISRENNAFAVGQNRLQGQLSNKYLTASPIAQSQITAGIEQAQISFRAGQDRKGEILDLRQGVANTISQNRQALNAGDPKFLEKLNTLATTGQGNIGQLAQEALLKGAGSGEENKAFSEVAKLLQDANERLSAINDNEATQVTISRQTQRDLEQRLAIEEKLNLLGGASGQLSFGEKGLERFANRDVFANLAARGGQIGQIGQREQAQGLQDFTKAFGSLPGFDLRSIVPDAEKLFKDAILSNLVQGADRSGIEVTGERFGQFQNIAELQAQNLVQKRELSDEDKAKLIGGQVGLAMASAPVTTSFTTAFNNASVTANTSVLPQIQEYLKSRFGAESARVAAQGNVATAQKEVTNLEEDIRQRATTIRSDTIGKGDIERGTGLTGFFSDAAFNAAKETKATDVRFSQFNKEGTLESLIGGQFGLERAIFGTPSTIFHKERTSVSQKDAIKNLNEALNVDDFDVRAPVKNALFTQFEGKIQTTNGKSSLTPEGEKAFLNLLADLGKLTVKDPATIQKIKDEQVALETQGKKLAEAIIKLNEFNKALERVTAEENIVTKNKPTVASGFLQSTNSFNTGIPTVPSTTFAGSGSFLNGPTPLANTLGDKVKFGQYQSDFIDKAIQTAKESQLQAIIKRRDAEAEAAKSTVKQTRLEALAYGTVGGDVEALERADQDKQKIAKANKEGANLPTALVNRNFDEIEERLLQKVQRDRITLGQVNPQEEQALKGANFTSIAKKSATRNSKNEFADVVFQAQNALKSGFADDSTLKDIGVQINQMLEKYARANARLSYTPAEVKQKGEEMRKILEEQLAGTKVKLGDGSKLKEFGEGFSSELEKIQIKYDDLAALGARTADSLTEGFGDAFFEVASGAKSAEDAVRGMLSGIAADLSKFFAKRAFAQLFASAAGNESASTFGGFGAKAQGGLIKRYAAGGKIPAMVMGGERAFSPDVVSALGTDFFHDLNAGRVQKRASGGIIKGGSGYKDDVFGNFDPGTFILRKSAVNKYGSDYLDQIENAGRFAKGGRVQKAFWGALLGSIFGQAVQGAAAGAITAKITGGDWKKGALYGGIAGGISGGISGYGYANSNPNAGFGGGFSNSFAWTGLTGDKGSATGSASGTASGTSSVPVGKTPGLFDSSGSMIPVSQDVMQKATIASTNGGNATGIGNQALTVGQTAAKPSIWKTAGTNLAGSLALALASSALAPTVDKEGNKIIKGEGSVTTYRPDGGIVINSKNGTYFVDRKDFSSQAQVEQAIIKNGGKLPAGGIGQYAEGGVVASGSGSIAYKDRAVMATINKTFPQGYALGGPVAYNKPVGMFSMGGSTAEDAFEPAMSPYISRGSGTGDDVKIIAKKGEFVMNDRATAYYGNGLMDRINRMEIEPQTMRSGVLAMEVGGPTEYNPSDRGRGMFSLQPSGISSAPTAPAPRGEGGSKTEINIDIHIEQNGTATASVTESGDKGSTENSIDSAKFASKVKMMFAELVEQEKRPGGSLSKENMT